MTTQPPRLSQLELTGPRQLIRRVLFGGVAVLSVFGALGYVLPAHRLGDGVHSNYADGGPLPLLAFLVVCVTVMALRRRGFGAGLIAGLVSMAGAVGAIAPVILVHLFQDVQNTTGEGMFGSGVVGLFFGGAAILLGEPIFYLLERRRIVRDVAPVFPDARLVRR